VNFRLETTVDAGIPVIRVHGMLDFASVARMEESVSQVLTAYQPPNLVIDLTASPMIDSAGLGVLVKTFKSVQERGGTMKIAGVNEKVAKLLGVTHLTGLFEMYPSAAEGVASFPRQ